MKKNIVVAVASIIIGVLAEKKYGVYDKALEKGKKLADKAVIKGKELCSKLETSINKAKGAENEAGEN